MVWTAVGTIYTRKKNALVTEKALAMWVTLRPPSLSGANPEHAGPSHLNYSLCAPMRSSLTARIVDGSGWPGSIGTLGSAL